MKFRKVLSESDIYTQFYSQTGLPKHVVIELWHEVAATLQLPRGQLRPDDRFGRELGAFLITSENLDTLSELAAARAKKTGRSIKLDEIHTLDEYIRIFSG